METQSDFKIITSSRLWTGTPWNYSSSRWLRFKEDETSDSCYGYGQTIYAVIRFEFQILTNNILKVDYSESPPIGSVFKGFSPKSNQKNKEIQYKLTKERNKFTKTITGREAIYHWKLELNTSPFPEELDLPYEIPLEYFGHSEC